jgi:hypothetical protein
MSSNSRELDSGVPAFFFLMAILTASCAGSRLESIVRLRRGTIAQGRRANIKEYYLGGQKSCSKSIGCAGDFYLSGRYKRIL